MLLIIQIFRQAIFFGAIAIMASLGESSASEGDILQCSVKNFINADDKNIVDEDFVNINFEKTFIIYEDNHLFKVISQSRKATNSISSFLISEKGILGTKAINISSIGIETLIIDNNINGTHNNYVEASVSFHHPGGVNTWFLLCHTLG